MQAKPLIIISTACLVCMDASGRLSFHGLAASLLTALLVLMPTCLPPRRWQHASGTLLATLFLLLCVTDCYCQLTLKRPISPQILKAVMQTDGREAAEYLTAFVTPSLLTDWHISVLLLMTVVIMIPLPVGACLPVPAVLGSLAVLTIIQLPTMSQTLRLFGQGNDMRDTENLIFQHHLSELSTPLHRLLFATFSYAQSHRQLERMKAATLSAGIDGCSHLSPHIVLVIGESYNKHHSSLYGYRLDTTPRQRERQRAGELTAFSNAVTPWNITSNVFFDLFSMWENGMAEPPTELPMFPILFRRAGYEVNFASNQYRLRGPRKGETNQAGNFFLADRTMSDSLFTHRIPSGATYDMEFLHAFARHRERWGQPRYTLDIIHLIGQHFSYAARYPRRQAVFTPAHYSHRLLDQNARQAVVHYDNATRYDDSVLDNILTLYEHTEAIVVFVADHGEEVYDETPVQGRLFREPTAAIARQEYEVPMWIWCSETYRQRHPDVARLVREAKDRPFMTDALPQVLLYLAGIRSRWYHEQSNLLSPSYIGKQRILGGTVDYDSITSLHSKAGRSRDDRAKGHL